MKRTKRPSMPQTMDHLSITFGKKVTGRVTVFDFKDGDYHVAYIPTLQMSAFGNNKDEAFDHLMNIILRDFLEQLVREPKEETLKELARLGWTRQFFKKQFVSESYVDENGALKNFDLPKETEVNKTVMEV